MQFEYNPLTGEQDMVRSQDEMGLEEVATLPGLTGKGTLEDPLGIDPSAIAVNVGMGLQGQGTVENPIAVDSSILDTYNDQNISGYKKFYGNTDFSNPRFIKTKGCWSLLYGEDIDNSNLSIKNSSLERSVSATIEGFPTNVLTIVNGGFTHMGESIDSSGTGGLKFNTTSSTASINNAFTLFLEFYKSTGTYTGGNETLFSNTIASNNRFHIIINNLGEIRVNFYDTTTKYAKSGAFMLEQWNQIVVTYNGAGILKLYINGIEAVGVMGGTPRAGIASYLFASSQNDNRFIGQIKNFRIWNGVKTLENLQYEQYSYLPRYTNGLVTSVSCRDVATIMGTLVGALDTPYKVSGRSQANPAVKLHNVGEIINTNTFNMDFASYDMLFFGWFKILEAPTADFVGVTTKEVQDSNPIFNIGFGTNNSIGIEIFPNAGGENSSSYKVENCCEVGTYNHIVVSFISGELRIFVNTTEVGISYIAFPRFNDSPIIIGRGMKNGVNLEGKIEVESFGMYFGEPLRDIVNNQGLSTFVSQTYHKQGRLFSGVCDGGTEDGLSVKGGLTFDELSATEYSTDAPSGQTSFVNININGEMYKIMAQRVF